MNKRILFLIILLTLYFKVYSQTSPAKSYTNDEQLWFGYLNQGRITNKIGFWAELQYRTGNNFAGKSILAIIRPGLTYNISERVRATAGYAFINHFPAEGHSDISQPEHRPWQQLQWNQKHTGFNTMQWIRLEQRYRRKIKNDGELGKGYNFNYRVRYNFSLFVPLTSKAIDPKTIFLSLNDEVHINFGKEIITNYFDQNRAFIGLGYQLSSHSNIQLGYMNLFQQRAKVGSYNNFHVIRLFLFHNLDFRQRGEN